MTGPDSNKIFAAILIAGITAYLAAFVADRVVAPVTKLETNAVAVEGGEVAGGAISGPSGPEPIMHLIASADVARGEKLSRACAACHSFDNGGANMVGPNIYGVVGKAKGGNAGFAYSDGLVAEGGSWDYDSLNKFLYKPKAFIEGTKMNYVGLKKPEDRAAMIAWLRTLGSSSYGLPSDAQIAAEKAELAPEPEVSEEDGFEGEEAEAAAAEDDAEPVTPAASH